MVLLFGEKDFGGGKQDVFGAIFDSIGIEFAQIVLDNPWRVFALSIDLWCKAPYVPLRCRIHSAFHQPHFESVVVVNHVVRRFLDVLFEILLIPGEIGNLRAKRH